jgi:predicted ATPase
MLNRMRSGMFVMDEPESALSPQRQLALLVRMAELVRAGHSQFVIATHSPILHDPQRYWRELLRDDAE